MSEPIIVNPAERDPIRSGQGAALGIGAFVLSVITGFWAIILWAVSIGASDPGSGRPIAIVFFAFCAIIWFAFFALTVVTVTFAFRRNAQLGRMWAALASVVGAIAFVAGVVLAVAVATS